MLTEKRCKELMEQVGLPNSRSLMQAFYQLENELIQKFETKNRIDTMARVWLSLGGNDKDLATYWERIMFRAKEILDES